jgi:MFS family permease
MSTTPKPLADDASTHSGSHAQPVTPSDISVGVVIGRIAQSFDMFVFGIACVMVFPQVFFPFVSTLDGMFYAFAIFAVAFVARPLGSLCFLPVHRRFGSAAKLTAALFMLGTATVGIAFMPGYEKIGWFAILALALLRFGQGFALGGSWNGLASLLALNAPKGRRGWYAMIPQLGAPIGFIIAAGLFAYIWSSLSHDEFYAWGWRYPFFAAFAVNVVALFARLRLVVSPEYDEQMYQRALQPSPVGELVRTQGRNIGLGAFAPLASYALFNLVTVFALAWALLFTTQSILDFLLVQIVGALVAIPCMFLSGTLADRFGRRTTLFVAGVLIAIYSGWTALLLSGGTGASWLFIILGFALLGFSDAQSAGAVSSGFRRHFRFTGASLTSDLGWLIGAGFAPLVALALAAYLGAGYVGLYLLSGAIGTLGALWVSHRLGGLPDD